MSLINSAWVDRLRRWLRPATEPTAPVAPNGKLDYEMRVCHNDRCKVEFKPWRKDQAHCRAGCAMYCLPCTRPRRRRNYIRERLRRQELRAVPLQPRYEHIESGRRARADH